MSGWASPAPKPDRKIPDDLRGTVLRFPAITQAQADAIAEVSAHLTPEQEVSLIQSWTETGGTHLYVFLSTGEEYHIAQDGHKQKMGFVDEP